MKTVVNFNFYKITEYADGTPALLQAQDGARVITNEDLVDLSDEKKLIRWLEDAFNSDDCIENLLFKHRDNPDYVKQRYARFHFKVTEAKVVQYPD